MSETYQYAVIGSGRQGTASAYDLARFGDAKRILLADYNAAAAQRAAERINKLIGREVATGVQVDVRDYDALVRLLKPIDACIFGVPFEFLLDCTRAAIESGTSMVDFGGHTDTVLKQLDMRATAFDHGVAVVPDCGMGPGLNNTLGVYVYEQLEAYDAIPREIHVWDGGLPQDPNNVWGYRSSFHINGLTNEYDGQALTLRDGKVTPVDTLTELETLNFDDLGDLEAFVTSGGSSTVPYTFEGRLQVYENKTLRYPGHYAQFKAFKDLGLFRETPIEVEGVPVKPRELYHRLLGPQIAADQVIDVCVMRVKGVGDKGTREVSLVVELVDYYDESTGFTAMERLTGWHAAIMLSFIAHGEVKPGVWSLEKAIRATRFMEAVRERGFKLTERWV